MKKIKKYLFLLLFTNIFLILLIFSFTIKYVNAQQQHNYAHPHIPLTQSLSQLPTPIATIGDKNLKMNFIIEPATIILGHNYQLKMSLIDLNSGEKIQHVTYRVTLTKDNQTKLSEFFHSHVGVLKLSSRNINSSNIMVEGTFDPLTNALTPDPSGTIVVTGPLFSEPGLYSSDIEINTINNDKIVLSPPLKFEFFIKVKNN